MRDRERHRQNSCLDSKLTVPAAEAHICRSDKKRADTFGYRPFDSCQLIVADDVYGDLERNAHRVQYMDITRGFHNESVTNSVVNLEDHDRASFFVRQCYGFAAEQ